jgi:hypothetical protein
VKRLVLVLAAAVIAAPLALGGSAQDDTLPRPPFPAATKPSPRAGELELVLVSSRRNAITDTGAWLRRNRLKLRQYRVPGSLDDLRLPRLPSYPLTYGDARLVKAISQGSRDLLVYGRDFASGRYLLAAEHLGDQLYYVLDFQRYAYAPVTAPGERSFVYQQVLWAAQSGGTVYVAHGHSTYARSSGGLNAYVTAINVATRRVKWRSGPLVANADTFEIVGGAIVTGYGFTAEPDYLYLLDRRNGGVIDRMSVPSAPELIVRKGGLLYVRTYDHDLVVKIVRAR